MRVLKNLKLSSKFALPIIGGMLIILLGGIVMTFHFKRRNLETTGLTTAQSLANQITTIRTFYTAEVVPRAKESGLRVNYDFASRRDTLPLPATFVHTLGERIEREHPGMAVRLYSRFPFPHRKPEETATDKFENEALTSLENHPQTPFYRLEEYKGRLSMRYAIADVMRPACVSCHNTHPETPKNDWKEGDVRGIVEVVVPMDEEEANLAGFSRMMVGGLTVMLVAIGAVILMILNRTVVRPSADLRDVTQGVAQNLDLSAHIPVNTNDEIGELAGAFNTFVQQMHHTIVQVAQSTEQLASASTELSSTAEEIAAGAEETSAQAETVAAATEEMSATAQQIAQNCADAAHAADSATATTQDGAEVVQQAITGMNQIATRVKQSAQAIRTLNKSAEKIGEIVGVINDIADQTNLLALNAAIEAARAGEQGRGFAVVADEVRKLAESTTHSTQEIADMIRTIQSETKAATDVMEQGVTDVEKGTQLTSQAGEALSAIAAQITNVTDMIRLVATAAEQQTATTGEITQNIHQVAEVIQQSAHGAQQSVQAALELASLSERLQQLVRQFRLRSDDSGHALPLAHVEPSQVALNTAGRKTSEYRQQI